MKRSLHDERVAYLTKHPYIIGLDHIIAATNEFNLYDASGNLATAVDVYFLDQYRQHWLLEYKCNDGLLDHGRNQLRLQGRLFDQYYDTLAHLWLVYGHKYQVEKLR